ncbi:unnamed protein product [Coregonus sp. 'balchen']|nr:unnamed protein product [Coregonus sp. 'balchen']
MRKNMDSITVSAMRKMPGNIHYPVITELSLQGVGKNEGNNDVIENVCDREGNAQANKEDCMHNDNSATAESVVNM